MTYLGMVEYIWLWIIQKPLMISKQDHQSPVCEHFSQRKQQLLHPFPLPFGVGRSVEEENGDQGQESHGGGKEVEVDQTFISHAFT
jgi:hypothetical protein